MKGALKIVLVVALIGAAGAGGFFLAGALKGPGEKAAGGAAPASSAAADAKPKDAAAKTDSSAGAADVPPPRRADEAEFTGTAYAIELAVFREKNDALEYAAEMRRRQLPAEVVETLDFGGRSWFRVRVGKFNDPDQAYARLADVQAVAGIEGVITLEKPAPALPPVAAAAGK